MDTTDDGVVSVYYRPLNTMDELHVLLLAAIDFQNSDPLPLEQVFSMPANVIAKEMSVLGAYGLAQTVDDSWLLTERGRQIIAVWTLFDKRGNIEVAATRRQWLLGPGEFTVDEMIRDMNEVHDLARGFGINDSAAAAKYLADRRKTAEQFASFLTDWPSTRIDPKSGESAEASVFDAVKLAETDEALSRVEELLAASVGEVVGRCPTAKASDGQAGSDGNVDAAESLRRSGQDRLKKFEEVRRNQRKANQRLAKTKAICEALLARDWLTTNLGSLQDAFDAEPAAFIFKSSVPHAATEVPMRNRSSTPPSPQPAMEPKQQESVLRTLFRWLFG